MGKSTKAEMAARLREVTKLLLAGAEFAEIRQFASECQWDVSDRSIRRYMEKAYKRMADASRRDERQLLGRHLMQRRALYARCLKQGDHRTALAVLKDEADLQGVYPPTKIAHSSGNGQEDRSGPVLPRKERLVRLLAAQKKNDHTELQLLKHATEYRHYRFPDTQFPLMLLQVMAMQYVNEQLERATTVLLSLWNTAAFGDEDGDWDFMGMTNAYLFRIGMEGWRLFCEQFGVDGDDLVQDNYKGMMLETCSPNICNIAPSAEELKSYLAERGAAEMVAAEMEAAKKEGAEMEAAEIGDLVTAEDLCKGWRRMIAQMLDR